MSKFNNLKVGDMIYITGVEANLYECNTENYDALLGIVNESCRVKEVSVDVYLYNLLENSKEDIWVKPDYCDEIPQRGVLIQSPKLQGHDGGGRCPEYDCYWIGEDYLSFITMSIDDTMNIFDKLNESDDFGWAEEIIKDVPDVVDYRTVKQGDKVVPGKDWIFGNQAQGSVYGIVDLEQYGGEPEYIDSSVLSEFWQYWVHVDWIGKGGSVMFRNNYRVGPDYHDLRYYFPKPPKKNKRIKESEDDDFEWVGETVNQEYFRYGDILPYLDNGDIISITGDFNTDEGELLLSVEDVPFKFIRYSNASRGAYLEWAQPEHERPEFWESTTNSSGQVVMTQDTFDWDKELLIKILHKEENPF